MSFKWLGSLSQLRIGIPLKKTTKWADQLESDAWMKIVEHDHSGTDGKGVKLGANSISDNSISTNKIQDNAVTTAKINDKAVTSAKLADNITIADSLTAPEIDVTSLMAANLITIPRALPGVATEGEIAVSDGTGYDKGLWLYQDGDWVSPSVLDDSISTTKLQDNAVTLAKMANDSVSTDEIVDNSITNAKMANDSVNTAELVNGAVTKEKLAPAVTISQSFDTGSASAFFNATTINITTTTNRPILITVSGRLTYTTGTSVNAQVSVIHPDLTPISGIVISRVVFGGITTISNVISIPFSGTLILTPDAGLNTFTIRADNAVGSTTLVITGTATLVQL